MSIEQFHVAPTEEEIVAERTRLVQNFKIAVGLKLSEGVIEGAKFTNNRTSEKAYYANPHAYDYWLLEYLNDPKEGVRFSAIQLRTSKLVHATPNENTYFTKDNELLLEVNAFRPSDSGKKDQNAITDYKELQWLEETVLGLQPLDFEEEQYVRESETDLLKLATR